MCLPATCHFGQVGSSRIFEGFRLIFSLTQRGLAQGKTFTRSHPSAIFESYSGVWRLTVDVVPPVLASFFAGLRAESLRRQVVSYSAVTMLFLPRCPSGASCSRGGALDLRRSDRFVVVAL